MVGVTAGGRYRNTSTLQYYRRLGVNTVRIFSNAAAPYAHVQGSSWGYSLSGEQVNNLSAWQAAVAQLRTPQGRDPYSMVWSVPNKWTAIVANLSPAGKDPSLSLAQDLQTFTSAGMGIEFILPNGICNSLPLTTQDYTSAKYWEERWEVYRITYVIGHFLALNGVANIETMNEPDLSIQNAPSSCPFTNDEWLDQLTIRSAAVRGAYADQSLPVVVKAGPFAKFGYLSKSTARLTALNAFLQFPTILSDGKPNTAKGPRLFDVFAYNMYNTSGAAAAGVATTISAGLLRDTGAAVPLSVGEYSAYTARDFDTLGGGFTADTPQAAARWAAQTAANLRYTSGSLAFTFGTNADASVAPNSGVKKDLLHWTETAPPYRVGDTTLSAEAVRLLFTYAAGVPILGLSLGSLDPAHTILAVDGGTHYRVFSITEGTSKLTLSVAGAVLGLPPGATITAEEVSATRRGELGTLVPHGGGIVSYTQPGQSLVMFSAPKGPAPVSTSVLRAAADTTLTAGRKQNVALTGAEPTLAVRTSYNSNQDVTSVALLRFDLGTLDPSRILSATLSLAVARSNPGPNIFTILGINGWTADWAEAGVTWSAMPNLAPLPDGITISSIGVNFINWAGTQPQPQVAGHVTPMPADANVNGTRRVDVTEYIRNGADTSGSRTLLIYRPFRHAAYGNIPADALTHCGATYWSAEAPAAALRPALTIQYR